MGVHAGVHVETGNRRFRTLYGLRWFKPLWIFMGLYALYATILCTATIAFEQRVWRSPAVNQGSSVLDEICEHGLEAVQGCVSHRK